MWRKTTLLLGVALGLSLASCGGEASWNKGEDVVGEPDLPTPIEYPPDQSEVGPFSLPESGVTATRTAQGLSVSLPVANKGDVCDSCILYLKVQQIGDEELVAEASQTTPLEKGTTTLHVELQLENAVWEAEEPLYTVGWELKTPEGTLRGTRSLAVMLEHTDLTLFVPETTVLGQPLTVRAQSTRIGDRAALAKVPLTFQAQGAGVDQSLLVTTDEKGLASFEVTPTEPGSVHVVAVESAAGSMPLEAYSSVQRLSRILLTTDKPLYQPGQSVHIRILALDRFTRSPLKQTPVVLEGFDGASNRIYKVELTTDDFGVASGTMQIGSLVTLGNWRLSATVGEDSTEKTIKVDRYALPRFKITTQRDKPWYKPGETMALEIAAQYFFGKPVEGNVKIDVYRYVGTWEVFSTHEVQINSEGLAAASIPLPTYLIGTPMEGSEGGTNQASVTLQMEVTDLAGHTEKQTMSVPVVELPYTLTAIPESGSLVPGLANRVFLFVTDPSGESAAGSYTLTTTPHNAYSGEATVTVPASGPLVVEVAAPAEGGCVTLQLQPANSEMLSRHLCPSEGSALLLRTDRALYEVGDEIDVDVYGLDGLGDAFLDVVRAGQTVLTQIVPMQEGHGSLILDLDSEMSGQLELHVYRLREDGFMARDTRLVVVLNNSELTVTTQMDKSTYRPGETAQVEFTVKDQSDSPAVAALGVQVVDEAVFALAESQPGLARLYFMLEDAILQAKASFAEGGSSFAQLAQGATENPEGSPEAEEAQEVAEAVLAVQGDAAFGNSMSNKWSLIAGNMEGSQNSLRSILESLWAIQLSVQVADLGISCDQLASTVPELLKSSPIIDPWGNAVVVKEASSYSLVLVSKGTDEEANTEDDIIVNIYLSSLKDCYDEHSEDEWIAYDCVAMDSGSWGWEDTVMPSEDMVQESDSTSEGGTGPSGVRVRQWFPETLFVAPSVITDTNGKASLSIPLADSITEWRMSTVASTATGLLGNRTDGFVVFQEFFVDIDLPKYLVRNDEITFPVLIYNYLEEAQTVELTLGTEEWFELSGASVATLVLEPGEVTSVQFPVKVKDAGWHSITVTATGSSMSDAVMRTVEVKPDGTPVPTTVTGRFGAANELATQTATVPVEFPAEAIPGGSSVAVRVTGSPTAVMTQGLDGMLQLPNGCFEQTTSSAWPNVLILSYLRQSEQTNAEIEMKALQYIAVGYQRILTFETPEGGFNWWEEDTTGNTVLSAVAIQMLTDTKAVFGTVEDSVIDRTFYYLSGTQNTDGSWAAEPNLHAGNEPLGASGLRTTCYITWSLGYGGYATSASAKAAADYVESFLPGETDPYTRALCANALLWTKPSSPLISTVMQELAASAIEEGDKVHWGTQGDTWCGSYGDGANVELTALAALAIAKSGLQSGLLGGAGNWLADSRDPYGSWGYNTQATVLALKALMVAGSANADVAATVEVLLNGASIAAHQFDAFNKDVVWQVELTEALDAQSNEIELSYNGTGNLSWQVSPVYYVPWQAGGDPSGPLDIDVVLDATEVAVDDIVNVTVTVTNTDPALEGKNLMVSVGIPAGFSAVAQDLELLKEQGLVQEVETTGREVLFYIQSLTANQPLVLTYGMLATMPVKSQGAEGQVYMYYDKSTNAMTPPFVFDVM